MFSKRELVSLAHEPSRGVVYRFIDLLVYCVTVFSASLVVLLRELVSILALLIWFLLGFDLVLIWIGFSDYI